MLGPRAGVALVGLAALAAALPTVAQERPAAPDGTVLPPVVITAPARLPGAPLPLDHVPGSVQVISGDAVRSSGAPSLQDALTRLPGVGVNDEQGNAVQVDLSLRGFQATSVTGVPQGVSVFVDGVRVNEPTAEEVNFDLIPLDDIERIEVIRGPTALFGRNALGGSINIVTRRGEEVRELEPAVEAGSFGRQKYRLRVSGPAGPFDYYLSGTYFDESGWREGSEVRLGKLFGKLGFRAGDTDVTVSYQRAQNRIEQAGSLPVSELGHDRRQNFTRGDFFAPLLNMVALNAQHQLGERTSVTVNGFARTLDVQQFNVNLIGENTRSFTHSASAGGTTQLDHDARPFDRANRLTLGLEYAHHDAVVTTLNETVEGLRTPNSKVHDDQHTWAVYAQDTLDVAGGLLRPDDLLVLTAAARFDWVRHRIGDAGPFDSRPSAAGSSTFSRANPRLGLNYKLSPAVNAYFVYAQGFRAPAFLELTCASPGSVCPGLQAGVASDPPIKAVTVDHYEVGTRLALRPWLAFDVALFRTDVHDDIFSISPTGTTAVFFQNVGETRRQGAEVSARATLERRWVLSLGYTYTESTFRDDVDLATPRLTTGCVATPCLEHVRRGSDLPLLPRHRLNASIDYHVTPWLTLWTSGVFVGAQRLRGDEANVASTLSPYVVVNAGARAHFKGLSAFLTVNNVLNDAHETFGTFAVNARRPGAPVEPFLTPAPPVNVVAGLAYRF